MNGDGIALIACAIGLLACYSLMKSCPGVRLIFLYGEPYVLNLALGQIYELSIDTCSRFKGLQFKDLSWRRVPNDDYQSSSLRGSKYVSGERKWEVIATFETISGCDYQAIFEVKDGH